MNNKQVYLGLFFIFLGVFWALTNFNIIPAAIERYLIQWENILILIGAFFLVTKENIRISAILLALGVFFSLDDWFGVELTIWNLWPLALVFIGIYLLGRNSSPQGRVSYPDETNTIQDTALFSGGDKVVSAKNFKGGTLTAMFGGSNIDLTTSDILQTTAVIDLFYLFGGSKIRVPRDWKVDFQVTKLFGDISDKRKIIENTNSEKQLIIIINY